MTQEQQDKLFLVGVSWIAAAVFFVIAAALHWGPAVGAALFGLLLMLFGAIAYAGVRAELSAAGKESE